jgi:hypothetical protein
MSGNDREIDATDSVLTGELKRRADPTGVPHSEPRPGPTDIARVSGYSRQHLLRGREGLPVSRKFRAAVWGTLREVTSQPFAGRMCSSSKAYESPNCYRSVERDTSAVDRARPPERALLTARRWPGALPRLRWVRPERCARGARLRRRRAELLREGRVSHRAPRRRCPSKAARGSRR